MIAILPPWFRMQQSFRKWWDSGNRWHLVNAGKYFSMFLPVIVVKAFDAYKYYPSKGSSQSTFWLYFCVKLFQTMYSLYWDYVWSWGLLYGPEGKRLLRNKISFSPQWYYWSIFWNTVLRFWWLLAAIKIRHSKMMFPGELEMLASVGMFLGMVRRTFWSFIRIENEYVNNFEQYRDIL